MNKIEIAPAISPAEQLAEAVKAPLDNQAKEQISKSTFGQLDDIAKIIEEKNIVIHESALALMRAQYDFLEEVGYKEIEKMVANKKTDKGLEIASNRLKHLHLIRLLGIKAPPEAPVSKLDFVASFLSGAAEKTKDIPVLSFITSFFKDMKGRNIERVWYNVLALFEKNPVLASTAASATIGPIGSLFGLLNFNFGGRRQLLKFDVLDAIDTERLVGETITFNGVSAGDMEKFKDKLATANVADLTTKYIRDQRKLVPAGSPITVTLEEILSPEKTQTKLVEQQTEIRKKAVAEKMAPLNISLVNFGSPSGAKKIAGERYEITVPEKDDVSSPEGRTLLEAMKNLPNAGEITIVSDAERLTLDLKAKKGLIPVGTPMFTDAMNRAFSYTNDRLDKIVFATRELPTITMIAEYDPDTGTLLLGANTALRAQALAQINGLDTLLASAEKGTRFTFNGSWTGSTTQPTPIPTL